MTHLLRGDLGIAEFTRLQKQSWLFYSTLDEAALTFHRFDALGRIKPYRDSYREALDRLPFTEEERMRLLAETSDAFAYNENVFASLG